MLKLGHSQAIRLAPITEFWYQGEHTRFQEALLSF